MKNQIPHSPLESSNEQNISKLDDFSFNTGTQPGQYESSLYGTLTELCKEKKMSFFKPIPYLDYLPPRLTEAKEWYISYSVKDPATSKMKRFRIKVNRIKSLKERRAAAKTLMARLTEQLALGWNPILEKEAPKAYTRLFDAMDTFLKIKGKETEANSMRSYQSYIKILKNWLKEYGFKEDMYACSFTKTVALDFMNDVEDDEKISARTYNNYRAFYFGFFNWTIEKGYLTTNPFSEIKKKPKKLTKKVRRVLSEAEIQKLFEWLQKENRTYLVMCLLCYCCFLRPKEIAMLRCSDIDLKKQLIKVDDRIAKNDNTSYRTIPDAMLPYMAELDLSVGTHYLFADGKGYDFLPGTKKVCSRKIAKFWENHVREACGFPKEVQFYSLKDSGMTNMADSGVPITFVKQQADHSSLAVTSIYLSQNKAKASEELKKVDIISGKKS